MSHPNWEIGPGEHNPGLEAWARDLGLPPGLGSTDPERVLRAIAAELRRRGWAQRWPKRAPHKSGAGPLPGDRLHKEEAQVGAQTDEIMRDLRDEFEPKGDVETPKPSRGKGDVRAMRARRTAITNLIEKHSEEFDEILAAARIAEGLPPRPEPKRPKLSKVERLREQLRAAGIEPEA